MAKEPVKFRSKQRHRKPEYSVEGMAVLQEFRKSNQGRLGQEIDPIIMGARKRGHGRGKASDAGPSKKRAA
jgi:hypothetical protein